jgi:regulator of sigma E protease
MVTGIVILIAHAYFTSESIITKEEVNKHGIYPSEWALESGFLTGDRIIAVNGKDYEEFRNLIEPDILRAPGTFYTVLRDNKEIQVSVSDMPESFMHSGQLYISLYVPFKISEVTMGSPADQAGIKPGDRITKVNGQPIIKFMEMMEVFRKDDDGVVSVEVERRTNDSKMIFTVETSLDPERKIGIRQEELIHYTEQKNSLWQAIQKGTSYSFRLLKSSVNIFSRVIFGTSEAKQRIGGPMRIAGVFEVSLWGLTASYAIWYAFYNILPLPKSAFWELIPLAYEGITKKKYPYTAFRRSLIIGWIACGVIFLWVIINDIIKFF